MQKLGFLALVLTLDAAAGPAVAASECSAVPEQYYKIDVTIDVPKAQVDHSRDKAALGLLSGDLGQSTIGLHRHGVGLSIDQQLGYHPQGEGICFWLLRAEVVVSYDTPTVYIAREYAEGSCNYRAILQHEAKHVQVAQTHIRQYKPRFHKALSALTLPRPTEPDFAADLETAKRQTLAQLADLVMPIYRRMQDSMATTQNKVDLPREYREVQRRCPSW